MPVPETRHRCPSHDMKTRSIMHLAQFGHDILYHPFRRSHIGWIVHLTRKKQLGPLPLFQVRLHRHIYRIEEFGIDSIAQRPNIGLFRPI